MYNPIEIDPATVGHSTLAVYLKATVDAQKWFEAEGVALMEASESTLESFGNVVDRVMVAKMQERVEEFVRYRIYNSDISTTSPEGIEGQFPAYVYVMQFTQVIYSYVHTATLAKQHAEQLRNHRILTPDQAFDPSDPYGQKRKNRNRN